MTSAAWKINQDDEEEIEKNLSVKAIFALNDKGLFMQVKSWEQCFKQKETQVSRF